MNLNVDPMLIRRHTYDAHLGRACRVGLMVGFGVGFLIASLIFVAVWALS